MKFIIKVQFLICFVCRFRYPFFGSQQPVVVQPPVSLVLGGENYFSASTYSFVFACSEDSLHNQLYCHPILLEVLMERGNCHSLVGIAQVNEKLFATVVWKFFIQVPLGEVLKNEKVSLGNDVYQRCSLKVPVSAVVSQLTCAFVHCTLTLEYQKGFPPAETQGNLCVNLLFPPFIFRMLHNSGRESKRETARERERATPCFVEYKSHGV